MKLFYSPLSPYVRKVVVTAREVGLFDKLQLSPSRVSPLPGAMLDTAIVAEQNPLGKIPTLVLPTGEAVYDSNVICEYLDDLAGTTLFPKGGAAKWKTLTMTALGNGILDAAVASMYEKRLDLRPVEKVHQPFLDGQWEKIARALKSLDAGELGSGDGPTNIGEITVACALGYLDFRHSHRGWRSGVPRLADWYARYAERPAFKESAPPS
ncbi:hypothetical protein HKX48_007025 [Thoreauomyces humboldtii]|nr:hypothetical protein HKX48_007025 [Thoreauomyces humboldtii]